jgi:hypothetical protein
LSHENICKHTHHELSWRRFELEDNIQTGQTEAALYVYELQVLNEFQGVGLGRHLMLLMEAAAAHHKMDKLLLTVFKYNPAVHFYRDTMGYQVDMGSKLNHPYNNETWELYKPVAGTTVLMMVKGSNCPDTAEPLQHLDLDPCGASADAGMVLQQRQAHRSPLTDTESAEQTTSMHTTVLQLIKGDVKAQKNTDSPINETKASGHANVAQSTQGSVFGASLIFTGTAVGAGMLALPAEMAPAGFVPSEFALLACWAFTYVSLVVLHVSGGLKCVC